MSDALSTLTSPAEITAYEAVLRDAARDFAEHATAESTERAYASAWRSFGAFTATLGRSHLPADPQTVADYVAALALRGRTPATIRAYLAAIAVYHRAAGHESPVSHGVVRAVMQGVRRTLGVAPKKKDALVREQLLDVVAAIPEDDLRGLRDRAMLLLGWAGALRRSEIGALDVEDVTFAPEGAIVDLRRSKTDQIGSGARIPIPRASTPEVCPVRALTAWLAAANISDGPLFRAIDRHGRVGARLSGRAVASIVQARAPGTNIGGHSLRSGFATSAARGGHTEAAIMRHGRWKSVVVARGYIRAGTLWEESIRVL
jgi:integrase